MSRLRHSLMVGMRRRIYNNVLISTSRWTAWPQAIPEPQNVYSFLHSVEMFVLVQPNENNTVDEAEWGYVYVVTNINSYNLPYQPSHHSWLVSRRNKTTRVYALKVVCIRLHLMTNIKWNSFEMWPCQRELFSRSNNTEQYIKYTHQV